LGGPEGAGCVDRQETPLTEFVATQVNFKMRDEQRVLDHVPPYPRELNLSLRILSGVVGVALIAGEVLTWIAAITSWSTLSKLFCTLFVFFCVTHLAAGVLWLVQAISAYRPTRKEFVAQAGGTVVCSAILWFMVREIVSRWLAG
jgi:hypothetical protein